MADTKPLDLSALTPEAVQQIAALVLALVQPLYTATEAQVQATLMLGNEARRIADAAAAFMAMPDGPEVDRRELVVPGECQHPEERRKSFATSVDDDFYCLDCNTMVKRPHAAKES